MTDEVAAPWGLLAELTHRCPLHCAYCSNPLELATRDEEMSTAHWIDALSQARALGVLQVHLSGGEPLARPDLARLVGHASGLGCYVNLVTSGLGLTEARLAELAGQGLAHVQLSAQAATRDRADRLAGAKAFDRKLAAAALIKSAGLPLTVNVVLHRQNHDELAGIIELAESLGADRLELANTQYYGWAVINQEALLPTGEQLRRGEEAVKRFRERVGPRVDVLWVLPDLYEDLPKPCMGGWGRTAMVISPSGDVL
ncbi:MAG: radical SAM protein, partial [Acidimicrobiales bacterium]